MLIGRKRGVKAVTRRYGHLRLGTAFAGGDRGHHEMAREQMSKHEVGGREVDNPLDKCGSEVRMTVGSNRHVIFVPLQGNCRINLTEGDYNIADGNCFDVDGARFYLPDPDPDGDGVTAYSVYARTLGKPGGSSVTVTCFDEAGETWCSTESVVLVRSTGKSTFRNVSKELLSLCLDTDGDLVCDTREFLFDRDLADYFWSYTNNGLRLAQLRFYEIPTP
jgi:hypothetical protein